MGKTLSEIVLVCLGFMVWLLLSGLFIKRIYHYG